MIRLIKNANRKNPYQVIHMKKENFKDFQSCAKIFNCGIILFKTLSQIRLTQSHYEVEYRMASNLDFIKVNIKNYERVIRNPTTIK